MNEWKDGWICGWMNVVIWYWASPPQDVRVSVGVLVCPLGSQLKDVMMSWYRWWCHDIEDDVMSWYRTNLGTWVSLRDKKRLGERRETEKNLFIRPEPQKRFFCGDEVKVYQRAEVYRWVDGALPSVELQVTVIVIVQHDVHHDTHTYKVTTATSSLLHAHQRGKIFA